MRSLLSLPLALLITASGQALAAPPANDHIAQAVVVTDPLPFASAVSTIDATTEATDPDCAGNGPTVWYRYTPAANGWVEANTFGSDYDTTLSAYTGSPASLVQIACNDDSGSLQSRVALQVTAGTTYYFMAGAYASGPGGNLVFNTLPVAPPVTVDVAILSTSVQPSTGSATVRVRATAAEPVPMLFLSASLLQRSGRGHIMANGGNPVQIMTNQFEATLTLKDLTSTREHGTGFIGGPARLTVNFFYVDPTHGFQEKLIEQEVKLKGGNR